MKRNSKGFTLIELLIVVAIIGIIAAIAIPNLLNAIQRGKQKRTMSDLRSIGTAVESYQVDNGYIPKTGNVIVSNGLEIIVEPTFIKQVPLIDAWQTAIFYQQATDQYSVISYGKDKLVEAAPPTGATTNFNNDIIFADGGFTRYPEGTQN
jgi:general secretion pathway protein G